MTATQEKLHNGFEEEPMFDEKLLHDIDCSQFMGNYKPFITPLNPGENLQMRPLCKGDYDKGHLQLLQQLTKVGDVTREEFEARFNAMTACPNSYFVTVIEDMTSNQVIASATLTVEHKFIHHCASRGRIEDVVVNSSYRGKQLGKLLLDVLTVLSQCVGCYKVSLECKDPMVPFYSQFGYVKEEGQNYMCRRFRD